jgi:DeoR family fructose operon transcriptional repressor
MRKAEREKYIIQVLAQNGFIDVTEIEQQCQVSPITARRDLDELAKKGFLVRTHGGAVKEESVSSLFSFSNRIDNNAEKKTIISRFAAQFIDDNDAILLDSGTTVYRLCYYILKRKNLQVITSSLPVASELIKSPHIKVFLIGGEVFPDRRATYGPIASEHISQYHVKKAFIGTDGISLQRGLTVHDVNEATRIKSMIEAADEVYLLCDSSKIESNSLFKLAPLSSINYIITDTGIENEIAEQYRKKGIKIFIAD